MTLTHNDRLWAQLCDEQWSQKRKRQIQRTHKAPAHRAASSRTRNSKQLSSFRDCLCAASVSDFGGFWCANVPFLSMYNGRGQLAQGAGRRRSESFGRRLSWTLFPSRKPAANQVEPPSMGAAAVPQAEQLAELSEGQAVWYYDANLGWILCEVIDVPEGGVQGGGTYLIYAPDIEEDQLEVERWQLHPALLKAHAADVRKVIRTNGRRRVG